MSKGAGAIPKDTLNKSSHFGEDDSGGSETGYANLSKIRQYLRSRVTRIHTILTKTNLSILSNRKVNDYITQLNSLSSELNEVNIQINTVLPKSMNLDDVLAQEDLYRDNISQCIDCLLPFATTEPPSSPHHSSVNHSIHSPPPNSPPIVHHNHLKLPPIEMPTFSNNPGDNLEKFLYAFEAIIDKNNLSPYEKFIYLQNQVHKGPKALLASLTPSCQTYAHAKNLLQDAFASPLTQKYDMLLSLIHI